MPKDPICGMTVDEKPNSINQSVEGTRYYFCSTGCLNKFTEPQREQSRLKRKLLVGTILTIPIIVLTYVSMLSIQLNHYVLFVLATPVQFWIGWRFYMGVIDAAKSKTTNMDVLIAVGTSTAWTYSSIVTFVPYFFPFEHVYFETSAIIIMLILTGSLLEHKTKTRALGAVRKLLDLQPQIAHIIQTDGTEYKISIEKIRLGDVMVIRPGEKIPADGKILEGHSLVDQSTITGESIPASKDVGDMVIGSTINKNGILKVRATNVGKDTVLSQIIHLVEEAKAGKVPLQRLVDKVSSYFVPVIVITAIVSALSWYFVGGIGLTFSILAFVSVIIIACPCAIGIAAPMALMIGASKSAENGILVKGGQILEVTRRITTIVFDKTGTLTIGKPSVTDVVSFAQSSPDEVLRLAAISEKGSEHPLAEAIVNHAKEKEVAIDDTDNFESFSGYGVMTRYKDHTMMLGNRKLLIDNNIQIANPILEKMSELESHGKTAVLLAVDGKVTGLIAMMDTIKESAREAISKLHKSGINTVMLTGDNQKTAERVANMLGIRQVYAEVLPDQKEQTIRRLKESGIVAMVGDGINDAPALAAADVGFAIGSGTDIAKETGDIIIIGDDLRQIFTALDLAKKTAAKIKQNLAWAFGYNAALVPIAAGVLVPFFGPEMYNFLPFLAAGAMAFSDVTVVGNSLLLGRYKP